MTLRQENFILRERSALDVKSGYYSITRLYYASYSPCTHCAPIISNSLANTITFHATQLHGGWRVKYRLDAILRRGNITASRHARYNSFHIVYIYIKWISFIFNFSVYRAFLLITPPQYHPPRSLLPRYFLPPPSPLPFFPRANILFSQMCVYIHLPRCCSARCVVTKEN